MTINKRMYQFLYELDKLCYEYNCILSPDIEKNGDINIPVIRCTDGANSISVLYMDGDGISIDAPPSK